jgi:molybdate transport system substrate-binding protein
MSKGLVIGLAVALVLLAACIALILWHRTGESDVLVLCGGSMRAPMEEIVARYAKESGDTIVTSYGDSAELCSQLAKTRRGDVFICHDPFMGWAEDHKLVDRWTTLAKLDIVIVVPKGNPKGLHDLKDLATPGLRLGISDTNFSTAGQLIKRMLKTLDYGEAIRKNVRVETKHHQALSNDVVIGNLDAAITWNAVAHALQDKLDTVGIPRDRIAKVDAVTSATYKLSDLKNIKVTMGLTTSGAGKEAARRFYEFAARQKDVFASHGFTPAQEP